MKMVNVKYNIDIDVVENSVYELILEHPGVFSDVVKELFDQCDGGEGGFVLSSNNSIMKFDKCVDIIVDYYSITLNNKKILNKLYSQLELMADDYLEEKININSKVVNLLDKLTTSLGFSDVNYNIDFKWSELFKIYNLEFIDDFADVLEKLIVYIKTISAFTEISMIILVNVRSYLSEEDLKQLYEISRYCKVTLFLIEHYECAERGEEMRYIIDKDYCLIDAN